MNKLIIEKKTLFETTHITKNGTKIPVEIGSIVFDIDKHTTVLSIARDISERKHSEEAIREIQARYSAAIEQSNDGITIAETDGRYVMVNPKFCSMTGYTQEELLKMRVFDLVDENTLPELLPRVAKDQEPENRELEIIRKDGTKFHALISGSAIDIQNKRYVQGIVRDITEWKSAQIALAESKEFLSSIVDSSSDLIWSCDPTDFSLLTFNHAYSKHFLKTHGVVVKKGLFPEDLLPGDSPKLWRQYLERAIKEGAYSMEYISNDGSRTLDLSFNLLKRENEVFAVSVFGKDITARKRDEAELEKYRNHLEELVKVRTEALKAANDELTKKVEREEGLKLILQDSLDKEKEVSEMKSRFISTTSHEFRTPLTSILSSSGLLQRYSDKWNSDKKNEHFDRIQNSVSYLVKLLDDILTISHADSGRINFAPELLDLKKVVNECIVDAQNLSTSHNINLFYQTSRTEFLLDNKLMKFIFNNLLSNAIKYSPNGKEVKLTIDFDDGNLRLEISDEGIGIPIEEQGNIFESFYRTNNAGEIRGTGLGLAIVKRAVDLHNGEITVSSKINIGTTFTVKIPV